ncbi:MAG: hypothetical protein LQ341_000398 [Variospora aurantia]|nr:MAG: hypothetical protein LQ341_000398 [Variospora aurantia]
MTCSDNPSGLNCRKFWMLNFRTDYIAAGGNRHPAAADWDANSGLLAYGSDRNVALWKPSDKQCKGVSAILYGHSDDVTAVKFFRPAENGPNLILSGSVDGSVRVWQNDKTSSDHYRTVDTLEGHTSSINCLGVIDGRQVLASGSADATIKVWQVKDVNHHWETCLLQTIQTSPKYLPLTVVLSASGPDLLLASAGTRAEIFVYAGSKRDLTHQATLGGHDGWVRCLALTAEKGESNGDILMASASQDKSIRLWRFRIGSKLSRGIDQPLAEKTHCESLLLNKTHRVATPSVFYSITFEALLFGHDDWIYTVSWGTMAGKLQLLSASADSSLAMWGHDTLSGAWLCTTRLGDISVQKGSTTATGSMGGFWTGLWSSDGQSVVSLGRTGSWRLWNYDRYYKCWMRGLGVSGHVKSVVDVAWARNGSYLLSAGADQTTRLHAEWIDGRRRSWHEFGRPQIHGYDLNCIDTVGEVRFVSGADEKLLRVFDEPKATAELLRRCCGIKNALEHELPTAANVPVLGLSNKLVEGNGGDFSDPAPGLAEQVLPRNAGPTTAVVLAQSHPPTEDDLARSTLWPESEKLYGHGYEISAVCASHNGLIIATACKASSLDHAVIRLFDSTDWRELKPPLKVHSLTVTCLRFSSDDACLLSTGRDRQWAVFERDEANELFFRLRVANPKAHSRMILSACWVTIKSEKVFVTASRDKMCKIWDLQKSDREPVTTIAASAPVTAVDSFLIAGEGLLALAMGTERGAVTVYLMEKATLGFQSSRRFEYS